MTGSSDVCSSDLSQEMAELIGKGTSKDAAFIEMQFIKNLGVVRRTLIFFILTPIEAKIYGCAFFFQ